MKNFTGIAGRLLGEDSMAHSSVTVITAHIATNETSYNYEFRQEKSFGGNFLDRINLRSNCFLGSCTRGDVKDIDTAKLDLMDMLEQIECKEYHTKAPSSIRKIMKKKKKKSSERDTKCHGGGGGDKSYVVNSEMILTGLKRFQMQTSKKVEISKLLSGSGTYFTLVIFVTWINQIWILGVWFAQNSTAWDSVSQTANSKMTTVVLMHLKSKGLRPLLV